MFNNGLSLDQAPPISIVLRFFITSAIFAIAAALFMMLYPYEISSSYRSTHTVVLVHLLLFGVAATTMIGALFQMLPVMAGVSIDNALDLAKRVHVLLAIAVSTVVYSLFIGSTALLMLGASIALVTVILFVSKTITKLFTEAQKSASSTGMILALTSLTLAIIAITLLATGNIFAQLSNHFGELRSIHIHLVLIGWIFTLICSVSFMVIEMFYVTPSYPKIIKKYYLPLLFTILLIQSVATFASLDLVEYFDLLISLMVIIFCLTTLRVLKLRKRPRADTTIKLWYTALTTIMFSAFAFSTNYIELSIYAFGFGVIAVIYAMSYKIVPFLVWFHLNAKGILDAPLMSEVISVKLAKIHLWLYWGTALFLTLSLLVDPIMLAVAGLLFLILNLIYIYNLYSASKIYYKRVKLHNNG